MYTNPAVQSKIRKHAREGQVIFLDHAQAQMKERDIAEFEAMHCLKAGALEGEDWHPEHQETTYRMVAIRGGSRLTVVVALDGTHDLVVTAFRKERI